MCITVKLVTLVFKLVIKFAVKSGDFSKTTVNMDTILQAKLMIFTAVNPQISQVCITVKLVTLVFKLVIKFAVKSGDFSKKTVNMDTILQAKLMIFTAVNPQISQVCVTVKLVTLVFRLVIKYFRVWTTGSRV